MVHEDPIINTINAEALDISNTQSSKGQIGKIANEYDINSDHLLGFLIDMSYDELQIVTCDSWKQRCGGVPRNSFVIVKLSPRINTFNGDMLPHIILARITDAVPTPVKKEIQQTIFQIHKVQAIIDPITDVELQWGGLKAKILGTYYDRDGGQEPIISFGSDIDSFFSSHFYEVYVPSDGHLSKLINSFVSGSNPVEIGTLRYTETLASGGMPNVPINISPEDFIKNRTALFGKTRMGKSNTVKVIADIILDSNGPVGQVIFDPSGEYSYLNEQDRTSLYIMHRERCVRYSLRPRRIEQEISAGLSVPTSLRANFYQQVELGHSIITSLFDTTHRNRPRYIEPLFAWAPVDPDTSEINERYPDYGDRTRYLRALSMYYALLNKAEFEPPSEFNIDLHLARPIKTELGNDQVLQRIATFQDTDGTAHILAERQNINVATRIYERLYELYHREGPNSSLFPSSERSGRPYFEALEEMLLRMLGDRSIAGPRYIMPFVRYHDPRGTDIIESIVGDVDANKTVIIDLSYADELVSQNYSELICNAILIRQMDKFANNQLGDHSVLFYFEEAHRLFRQDDKDLTSVYNKLANEGAKFAVGMVYATQSMTTLSPDLLKNTENFFIAHLNDDREIKELTRKYEFQDIGIDVQRSRTKGYVRMITLSHRFALPVQIRKFESKSLVNT
jgi:DNA helicase HerA-like ATPase